MAILIYMSLLLGGGFLLRLREIYTGTCFLQGAALIVEDIAYGFLAYFGVIGLYGYARCRPLFSRRVWRIHFVVLAASLPITPLVSVRYRQLLVDEGVAIALATYAISTVLVLPAYWAWYRYAFRAHPAWQRHPTAA